MIFSMDHSRTIVCILGNLTSLALFLAPAPTFIKIYKKKAVEEQLSPIPYQATLLSCMLWIIYGVPLVHPDNLLMVTINGIGFVIEFLYFSIFFAYASREQLVKMIYTVFPEAGFIGTLFGGVIYMVENHYKCPLLVGILYVICNILMYASPFVATKMVIQTKSVKYMPINLSFFGFLNAICWIAYSLIRFDPYILVSNGLGAVLAAVQLILYAIYYRTTDPDEEPEQNLKLPEVSPASDEPDDKLSSVTVDK